jgi:hypothetical protein
MSDDAVHIALQTLPTPLQSVMPDPSFEFVTIFLLLRSAVYSTVYTPNVLAKYVGNIDVRLVSSLRIGGALPQIPAFLFMLFLQKDCIYLINLNPIIMFDIILLYFLGRKYNSSISNFKTKHNAALCYSIYVYQQFLYLLNL